MRLWQLWSGGTFRDNIFWTYQQNPENLSVAPISKDLEAGFCRFRSSRETLPESELCWSSDCPFYLQPLLHHSWHPLAPCLLLVQVPCKPPLATIRYFCTKVVICVSPWFVFAQKVFGTQQLAKTNLMHPRKTSITSQTVSLEKNRDNLDKFETWYVQRAAKVLLQYWKEAHMTNL